VLNWKDRQTNNVENEKQRPVFYFVAADVEALYPSLCGDTVTNPLDVLWRSIPSSTKSRKIIVEQNLL